MNDKINLLDSPAEQEPALIKPGRPPKNKPLKALAYVLIFLFVIFLIFKFYGPGGNSSSWLDYLPFVGQVKHLVESANTTLKGEDRNRINILLLGIGGQGHDGAYLTDTIMLASLQPKEKKAALVSIPRDLSVPIENMGWRKINNINAFAEMKTPGSGGLAVSQAASNILQTPIDYYLTVDFSGFEKIIDDLGGIKINVENTLDDYKYPILGSEDAPWDQRWEHLRINAGEQTMNGELALKYVRSRHALGAEGSDFARSRRQQKVLEAVKEKVMSLNMLFHPGAISKIIGHITGNYQTNLKIWEIIKLWGLVKDINGADIVNRVLDNSPSGLLVDTIGVDGAYLLSPRSGNFLEIQYLVNNLFNDAPANDKETVAREKASIEIRNGTWINGLASRVALDLEKYGFDIVRVGNSSQQNFQKSVVYDLTYGAKIQALRVLKNKTNANVSLGMPQWLIDDMAKGLAKEKNPVQPDFILLLGEDADATRSGVENAVQ
ncbi:MAG: LCP family protein [bacterium]|nr:LCP family protein [bacterium]